MGALHFELHAGLAELARRGMQNKDSCFRKAIEDSLRSADETVHFHYMQLCIMVCVFDLCVCVFQLRFLQHEPIELTEGQIHAQTKANIESLKVILASTAANSI